MGRDIISVDKINEIKALIPTDRGTVWSLKECYYGSEDKKATKEFKTLIDDYEGLLELALMIEGLIKSRGVHPSGVFITNTAFTDFGAKMVSPKGIVTSQWELHDSEYAGLFNGSYLVNL